MIIELRCIESIDHTGKNKSLPIDTNNKRVSYKYAAAYPYIQSLPVTRPNSANNSTIIHIHNSLKLITQKIHSQLIKIQCNSSIF